MASLLNANARRAGPVRVHRPALWGRAQLPNFQPQVGKTVVTDRQDDSLTCEPEMIQAYRDTWELGVHLFDPPARLFHPVARELLHRQWIDLRPDQWRELAPRACPAG